MCLSHDRYRYWPGSQVLAAIKTQVYCNPSPPHFHSTKELFVFCLFPYITQNSLPIPGRPAAAPRDQSLSVDKWLAQCGPRFCKRLWSLLPFTLHLYTVFTFSVYFNAVRCDVLPHDTFSVCILVLVQSAWWWPIFEVETSSQTINWSSAANCVWQEVSIHTVNVTPIGMVRIKVV